MHFTSFTAVRGNLSIGGTATLGATLPESGLTQVLDANGAVTGSTRTAAVSTVSPSIQATVAANPNFELAVYDTKEFESGILTPVKPSLIEYYLRQGWPPQFLSALFVSQAQISVQFQNPAIKPLELVLKNNPADENFGQFVNSVKMVPGKTGESAQELIPVSKFSEGLSLADIEKLDGSKFGVQKVDSAIYGKEDVYIVRQKGGGSTIGFEFTTSPISSGRLFDKINDSLPNDVKDITISCGTTDNVLSLVDEGKTKKCLVTGSRENAPSFPIATIQIDFFIRSPESIVYFLGAYARCQLGEDECAGKSPYLIDGKTKVIELTPGSPDNALITVRHMGKNYSLKPPVYTDGLPDHRGSQALVLVQQLINLHKSADSLPASSAIQLIP